MRAVSAALALLLAASVVACDGEDAEDPARAVARAARTTFDREPGALSLRVRSPDASWAASGTIELARGRFRLEARGARGVFVGPRTQTVVGTSGEGYESTFQILHGGFVDPHSDRRCWFNPHLPVGSSHNTLSVEESVRLVGAIVESLRKEIGRAAAADDGVYAVSLKPSATRPREDFHETARRVWGDRRLLLRVTGPIRAVVGDGGRIESLDVELRGYRAGAQFRHPLPVPVSIQATLASTDRPLRLHPPGCLAME
jgi:hypothetical protein